jgi:hypothetical protein
VQRRNRHHRSRSTEYDLSVDSECPDASRSRRKTDTGSTIPPPGAYHLIRLTGITGGHETARPRHHQPGQIASVFLIRFDYADKLALVTENPL